MVNAQNKQQRGLRDISNSYYNSEFSQEIDLNQLVYPHYREGLNKKGKQLQNRSQGRIPLASVL
ncbi:hypothetical protein SpAn4DRAFT_3593 [Sporomusa ovata]|uniref:Uncharacterized protein n=1 Tax=Sporomusa ovata TaxID=2378 RepID=A0A0U1KWC8_9FIRM|nr:hypothetical protein SpAn4DRAFT_3593 [Sporomusa ovata]